MGACKGAGRARRRRLRGCDPAGDRHPLDPAEPPLPLHASWQPPTIEKATTEKVTSLDSLSTLASKLLMNAASLRVVRKETFCVHWCGDDRQGMAVLWGLG